MFLKHCCEQHHFEWNTVFADIGVVANMGVAKACGNVFVENQDLDNFGTSITKSTKMVKKQ